MNDQRLPDIRSTIPGPRTREIGRTLRQFESRNVTYVGERFPIFWESASGAAVTDVDGNRYIDLTAAFGVTNSGHSNPRVADAIHRQALRLPHAMGDVHPTEIKVRLLETLARLAPGDLDRVFLASTGSEAVEAAIKTAILATGKCAFAAYRGAYHGLSLGTLEISGIEKFRAPFSSMLPQRTLLLEYPHADSKFADTGADAALARTRSAITTRTDLAAVFIEPIQARGGCIVPPKGYLTGLRSLCDELGILLIVDEIYTGFGRTGALFALQDEGVVPDILCIGKALANGFPISATVARTEIMDAWPTSPGEALHTSTYLGNPMGCAAALANIDEILENDLPGRSLRLGALLGPRLMALRRLQNVRDVRGRGLMWGIELADAAAAQRVVTEALHRGVVLLQAGLFGNVLSITPPLVITEEHLFAAIDIVECLL